MRLGKQFFPSLISLLIFANAANGHKILVYNSKSGHSHSQFLGTIADILVEAGHNVTSLIPIMDAALADGTTKSQVIYVQPHPEVAAFYDNPQEWNFLEMNMWFPLGPFFVGPSFAKNYGLTCQRVLEEPGLIDRLRAEKYDAYITENFDYCGIGLAAAIGPKSVIGTTSTCLFGSQFDEFGVEQALSYRPSTMTESIDVHSWKSRAWNLFGEALTRMVFAYPRNEVDRILKKHFGEEYPTIAKQSSRVAYVFTNSEPLIETAAPTSARIVDISGIGAKTPKPLDKYWEEVLNRRPKTVLFSLGSIVKSFLLSDASKASILKALAQFPDVTFIWKYEQPDDEFSTSQASKLDNLVMSKWVPQVDLLNHAKLAAFISHGGMGSTHETALRGVPAIFVPVFGDQPRNAGMMEANGLGIVYDKFEIKDFEKLTAAIREVLENRKYTENAQRIAMMLARKPFKSRELLIKHVEFAAEFGPSPALRPQSADMSTIEYYNLDVIAVTVVPVILSAVLLLKLIARAACAFVRRRRSKNEKLE